MTIAELNAMDRAAFVEAVGWVFEHSPWVAERVWTKRPFPSLQTLHGAMASEVGNASQHEQLALLRAHPDLGARAAMSDASVEEQTGAGLDELTAAELDRLRALNAVYRDKFGFPFVYAVKGSSKRDILDALERRLPGTRDAEQREALLQVYRIAKFRLEEVIT